MTSFIEKIIFFSISIITLTHTATSAKHDSKIEQYLKDTCFTTNIPQHCWKIVKPEINRFTDTKILHIASIITDLAITKSTQIKDEINKLSHDSANDAIKYKYISCSKNYNNVNNNLFTLKRELDSNHFHVISSKVDAAAKELKKCKHGFEEESLDLTPISHRNKEFGYYMEIVRAATKQLLKTKNAQNA